MENNFVLFVLLLCVRLKPEIYCLCRAAGARSRDRLLIILFCKLLISVSEGNLPINKRTVRRRKRRRGFLFPNDFQTNKGAWQRNQEHISETPQSLLMGEELIEREYFARHKKRCCGLATLWMLCLWLWLSSLHKKTNFCWMINNFPTFSEIQSLTVILKSPERR